MTVKLVPYEELAWKGKPAKATKEVQIGQNVDQTTRIDTSKTPQF